MKNTRYKYVKGNLLENPQNYQMTPFEGVEFLKFYNNSRKNILKNIEKKCGKVSSIDDILNDQNILDFKMTDTIITENFLKFSLKGVIESSIDENIKNNILLLIKKFETKKRLYTNYDISFKKTSKEYSKIINYILLASICIIWYDKNSNLKYLNTALKLNDTIISQLHVISDLLELSLLHFCIEKELQNISNLVKLKGIKMT